VQAGSASLHEEGLQEVQHAAVMRSTMPEYRLENVANTLFGVMLSWKLLRMSPQMMVRSSWVVDFPHPWLKRSEV